MRRFAVVTLIALTAACISCAGGSSNPTSTPASPAASAVPTVTFGKTTLRIDDANGRAIDVETATTSEQSERGLGYRDALAADAGMLFDLHETRLPTFWMKGMRFALDMVWVGEDGRVAKVTTDIPAEPGVPDASLRRYSPDAPVRYVLELNAGAAERLEIAAGTQLSFAFP